MSDVSKRILQMLSELKLDLMPSLNTQSCIKRLLVVRNSVFWTFPLNFPNFEGVFFHTFKVKTNKISVNSSSVHSLWPVWGFFAQKIVEMGSNHIFLS